MAKVIGTFGKGTDGSVSLNFSASGTSNCSRLCRHHPESNRSNATRSCYAAKLEKRHDRKELRGKLERHESLPAWEVCGRALVEIQRRVERGHAIPWLRVSTNGSVPMPGDADQLFKSQFRALLSYCRDHGIPVHLPVETHAKAEFYRSVVGDLVTVRESLQAKNAHKKTAGAVSWVAGEQFSIANGDSDVYAKRVAEARKQARERYERVGRKTIVCPAVVAGFNAKTKNGRKNDRAKCGNCTACAQPTIDVVYPLH